VNIRFKEGHPNGLLTIKDKNNPQITLGWMIIGGSLTPGSSEIAYLLDPNQITDLSQTEKSVVDIMTNQIVPEIRRIGLGTNVAQNNIVAAFQCYRGKTLDRLESTSSPSNEPCVNALDSAGFVAASQELTDSSPVLDFSNSLISYFDMENDILKHYGILSGESTLEKGKLYRLIDTKGVTRTFNFHPRWEQIKFHFEKNL
jgi:hypothetical protein